MFLNFYKNILHLCSRYFSLVFPHQRCPQVGSGRADRVGSSGAGFGQDSCKLRRFESVLVEDSRNLISFVSVLEKFVRSIVIGTSLF